MRKLCGAYINLRKKNKNVIPNSYRMGKPRMIDLLFFIIKILEDQFTQNNSL